MRGNVLVSNPSGFPTFELAHRIDARGHRFEIAYGTSFNELYYDFSPEEFASSANRGELIKHLDRAGLSWLSQLLYDLAAGDATISSDELRSMIQNPA
jgi:hypothetical protein